MNSKIDTFALSIVDINKELIKKVADRCSVSEDRIKEYLSSNEQNREFLAAFLFYGIGPVNKH